MKKLFALSTFLVLLAAPGCQTRQLQERIVDQDEQLTQMQAERQRMISERQRVQAENAEFQSRLDRELAQNRDLRQRVNAMEASVKASDEEVLDLRAALTGTGVGVNRRGSMVVLDLPQKITFPSGKAALTEQGKTSLQVVANALSSGYPDSTFWVEGHTDNDPIRKSEWRSNLHLSVERALSVAEFLTTKQGLSSEQVRVAGHGPNLPKSPNDSNESKSQNRRVEILILNPNQ